MGGATKGDRDVFVYEGSTGVPSRVSTSSAGVQANSASYHSVLTGDGRYVTFDSVASNLVPGDVVAGTDVFVRDLSTGVITLVSVKPDGAPAGGSNDPAISDDGRLITFVSLATTLVDGDSNGHADIFVNERPAA